MQSPNSSPTRSTPRVEANWLLAALPEASYGRVNALCETVSAPLREVLGHPDVAMEYAYFPQSGCLSMVAVMGDGSIVEVGTIGWEGMAGVSLLNGVDSVPTQCVVQVSGTVKRIPLAAYKREIKENDELSNLLHRYSQVWTNQVARNGACNGVHTVEQRCARWLLMTHDRIETDLLPLTQEFLGVMLGVRRASVTVAAAALHKAGLINYKHGKIVVLDRKGLEAASCECYASIQGEYAKLLPVPRSARNASS